MSQTIQGTYKNGKILLDRLPDGVTEARVAVQFSGQQLEQTNRRRGIAIFGMFAPADGQFTTDDEIERVKKPFSAKLDE